jgi:hypothetical protein
MRYARSRYPPLERPRYDRRLQVRAHDVALFIHLLGVITLFIAFGILQRGGARARQARTVQHLRLWLDLLRTTAPMFPAAFVMILGAGLYMTADVWTFSTEWVLVALVAVGVMMAVGFGVVGRGLNRMGAAAANASEASVSPELRAVVVDPTTWVSASVLNGIGLGVLWLMVSKPGWGEAIIVPIAFGVAGAIAGSAALRRDRASVADRVPRSTG